MAEIDSRDSKNHIKISQIMTVNLLSSVNKTILEKQFTGSIVYVPS